MVYKTALEVFESPSLAMFWLGIDNMNNNYGQFRYVSDNKIATNNETVCRKYRYLLRKYTKIERIKRFILK